MGVQTIEVQPKRVLHYMRFYWSDLLDMLLFGACFSSHQMTSPSPLIEYVGHSLPKFVLSVAPTG